jgi:predicted site-specific integrase-resolvase
MATRNRRRQKGQSIPEDELLTLEEVARRSGISTPTLRRYGRLYRDRIPSIGSGRRKRYPEGAVAVFQELKRAGRRGRRPLVAAAKANAVPKGTAGRRGGGVNRRSGEPENLLTLRAIRERTGIAYPTLERYVRLYLERLPHEGVGRARRFRSEAVGVFEELRRKSRSGGMRASRRERRDSEEERTLRARVEGIERKHHDLERRLNDLAKQLGRWL